MTPTSALSTGWVRDRLGQFILVLMTASTIRRAGLELRPTCRQPNFTIMLPEVVDVETTVWCICDLSPR